MKYLLNEKLDIHCVDDAKNNAFLISCFKGPLEHVELIAEEGFDVNVSNKEGIVFLVLNLI